MNKKKLKLEEKLFNALPKTEENRVYLLKKENEVLKQENKNLKAALRIAHKNQTPTKKKLYPMNYDKLNLADKLRYRNQQIRDSMWQLRELYDQNDDYERTLGCISEALVSESKMEISSKECIKRIRKFLGAVM